MKDHKLGLKMPGIRVLAVNSVPETETVPQGLQILVTLRAKSIEESVTQAGKAVEFMGDAFALALAAATGECRPEFAVDFSENAAARQVYQRVPIPPVLRPMRTLSGLTFVTLMGHLARVASEHQPRLQRAVAWLRKSFDQESPHDELVNLWMGLEAVSPLVSERHLLRDAEEIHLCPHCLWQLEKHPTKAGVNYVMRELMNVPADVAKRLSRLRNALLHSFEPVADLDKQLEELLPIARRALAYAILDVAKVPRQDWDVFAKQPLPRRNEAYFELYSEAEGMTRDHIVRDGALPLLKLVSSESKHTYGALGLVHTDVSVHLEHVRKLPYSLAYKGHRTVTVSDPEDKTARIETKELRLIAPDEPIPTLNPGV